jgi:hypothetical protein
LNPEPKTSGWRIHQVTVAGINPGKERQRGKTDFWKD